MLLRFFLALLCLLVPISVFAALPAQVPRQLVRQEISIRFDLAQGLLHGQAVITMPPDTTLRLSCAGLEQVSAVIDGRRTALPADKILFLPPDLQERKITLSWQVASNPAAGILISKEGISLTGAWHPIADKDMFFSLSATLPDGFTAISEGNEIESGPGEYAACCEQPLPGLNFAAGPYSVITQQVGKIEVSALFFPEDAELAADYLAKAAEYLRRYEKLLGLFPYPRYTIVENRLPTGYGMPGFTLLGQTVVRLPFIKDTSLGHELLHSWFGNAVRDDGQGTWSEGLTTYLADQSFAADKGQGPQHRKQQLLRHQAWVDAKNITAVIDFRHGGKDQPNSEKMRAIGYDKTSMIFHALRGEIGDQAFFAGLRRLCAEKKFQQVGWPDLVTLFSESVGRDLSQFFGQWLLRNDLPLLKVEEAQVSQKDGQSLISFRLLQDGKDPYRLRVPVSITTLHGEVRKILRTESLDQRFTLSVDGLPSELALDPEYDVPRRLSEAERPPLWMQLLGAEKKTVVLPDGKDLEKYLPLLAVLERRGCRVVKADALQNSELAKGSFVFFGSSAQTKSLFGAVEHPAAGFTLDVRPSPLNLAQVMALVSSSSTEETAQAMRKLEHYGGVSYLHFLGGKLEEKRLTEAENGIHVPLRPLPVGIPAQPRHFAAVIEDISQSRVVYAGEIHTDYGAHLLQLQLIQALYERQVQAGRKNGLAIGLEMFPHSSQAALDDWISGKIATEREFLQRSGYFESWGFDYRFYRDIINYAKAKGISLIALNLDKNIVSSVFRSGSTDSLSPAQQMELAKERDLTLPGYRQRLEEIHALHKDAPQGSNFSGFLQAQAIWDETMAENAAAYLRKEPHRQLVVLAGVGHVSKENGIPPRLKRRLACRQSVVVPISAASEDVQADWLLLAEDAELPPAGKLGVLLEESAKTEKRPAQVSVSKISPESKADEAGLQEKDLILAMDGQPVASIAALKAGLLDKKPDETVLLKISRNGKELEMKVELMNE